MCKHGNEKLVWVKVPADLSAEGIDIFKWKPIDGCIADLVQALQNGGIDMRGSCCGHGDTIGHICLQDGRVLLILDKEQGKKWLCADSNAERRQLLSEWLDDRKFPLG
jgi:uncharacterized protein YggL (DUF469 family)